MKTVKEVSKLTGVSIRTLRYYDEIGLLKPTQLTEAGYRLYDNRAMEQLQEIMFFRELEIPLADIKNILDHPAYDREQILATQKALLEHKRSRLNGIIELITDVMKGVNTMNFDSFTDKDAKKIVENLRMELSEEEFEELMDRFGNGNPEDYEHLLGSALQDEKIGAELIKWYGSKEKAISGSKPIPNMEDLQKENEEICTRLAQLLDSGDTKAENSLISRLAEVYKQMFHLDNARALLLDMAKEYLENEQLAAANDSQYRPGSAKHMAKAIWRYYGI